MQHRELKVELAPGKKIYFASDFHFGIPDYETTRAREQRVCQWLDSIKADAQQVYLMGDLYDAWMEYARVVPKGTVRFLGKLAELSDAGIEIMVFTGNHDLWMHGYFEQELGAQVYHEPRRLQIGGKRFYVGHGDGISPKERKYNFLKAFLRHPLCQWLYRRIHPDTGVAIADFFSRQGPKHKYQDLSMKSDSEEYQLSFAAHLLESEKIDYFIFGHRHIPLEREMKSGAVFINLGDWISYDTYAVFDGQRAALLKY